MTLDAAMVKLAEDKAAIMQALSTIETAEALYAVGEPEKAVEVGVSAWFLLRRHLQEQWRIR